MDLFSLFVSVVILCLIVGVIWFLWKYVTIIPEPLKQVIVSVAAILLIVYLVGILFGKFDLPSFAF